MTVSNNGKSIPLVIIIVVLAFFAFGALFFFLQFGVFPGRAAGQMGYSISNWLHGFGPIGRMGIVFLPVAFLVLWGAVLIWVYRDAEMRGMSGILWVLLILIANVVGLLIYAIVRSETPAKRQLEGAGGSAGPGKCPGCGNPVGAGHSFCPHCGKNLKPACPACGKPIDQGWKACPACGAGLDPGQPRQV